MKNVLSELCPDTSFEDAVVHQYYIKLALLIGDWLSEQQRLESSPVKKAFLTLAKDLGAASASLSGLDTGLRSDLEIEITSRLRNLLALDPTIGSSEAAEKCLKSFSQNAQVISQACLVAAYDLPSAPAKRGAKKKDFYGAFTNLLLSIAKQANVRPTLYRSAARQGETGWLMAAARVLETFLPKEMRSTSDGARYKRLERAKAKTVNP